MRPAPKKIEDRSKEMQIAEDDKMQDDENEKEIVGFKSSLYLPGLTPHQLPSSSPSYFRQQRESGDRLPVSSTRSRPCYDLDTNIASTQ